MLRFEMSSLHLSASQRVLQEMSLLELVYKLL